MTETVDGSALMDTVERTYFAFRRRLRDIGQASACDCNACMRMPASTSSSSPTTGRSSASGWRAARSSSGSPVIVAHRLLKNAVTEETGFHAYALYTEDCLGAAGIDDPAALGLLEHREDVRPLGEVDRLGRRSRCRLDGRAGADTRRASTRNAPSPSIEYDSARHRPRSSGTT